MSYKHMYMLHVHIQRIGGITVIDQPLDLPLVFLAAVELTWPASPSKQVDETSLYAPLQTAVGTTKREIINQMVCVIQNTHLVGLQSSEERSAPLAGQRAAFSIQ